MLFIKSIVKFFMLLFSVFVSFLIVMAPLDDKATMFFKYEFIRDNLLYDHIIYEEEHYYMVGTIPDEYEDYYVPFAPDRIYVTLVDAEGDPYDESIKEEARTYVNDDDMLFIYYGSSTFTKDKSLILEGK